MTCGKSVLVSKLAIRVYLGFYFIGFMLLHFCSSIGVYIYLNTLHNNTSLFHNMVSERQA